MFSARGMNVSAPAPEGLKNFVFTWPTIALQGATKTWINEYRKLPKVEKLFKGQFSGEQS